MNINKKTKQKSTVSTAAKPDGSSGAQTDARANSASG